MISSLPDHVKNAMWVLGTTLSAMGVGWGTYTIVDNKTRHDSNDARVASERAANIREHDRILDGIEKVEQSTDRVDCKLDKVIEILLEKGKP